MENGIFDVAAKAAAMGHTLQFLTKRPEKALDILGEYCNWLKDEPNIYIGVSAENQEWADKRIPILLQIPAAVRFVSLEPLLGPIDLEFLTEHTGSNKEMNRPLVMWDLKNGLDWIIVGAESKGAWPGRECKTEWIDSIVNQGENAEVPIFVKQVHHKGKLIKDPKVLWQRLCYPQQYPKGETR